SWAASSDRLRMKPTCGPLPWVIAMRQPSLIMVTMWRQVSLGAMYWPRPASWSLSLIRELPPIATTAMRLSMWVSLPLAQRQRHDRLLGVQAVLGLVVDRRLRSVDHRVGDLDVPVGRQRVHEDGVRPGGGHPRLVGDPRLVGVNDLRARRLVRSGEHRPPALGVDDVRAAEAFA